jgi:hypothetical protein
MQSIQEYNLPHSEANWYVIHIVYITVLFHLFIYLLYTENYFDIKNKGI